jgi:hypothetical protein
MPSTMSWGILLRMISELGDTPTCLSDHTVASPFVCLSISLSLPPPLSMSLSMSAHLLDCRWCHAKTWISLFSCQTRPASLSCTDQIKPTNSGTLPTANGKARREGGSGAAASRLTRSCHSGHLLCLRQRSRIRRTFGSPPGSMASYGRTAGHQTWSGL